jgi:hypothetical protein
MQTRLASCLLCSLTSRSKLPNPYGYTVTIVGELLGNSSSVIARALTPYTNGRFDSAFRTTAGVVEVLYGIRSTDFQPDHTAP